MQGSFSGLPARVRERGWGASSSIGAYEKVSSHHARGACVSVAPRLEIGSSGEVYFHHNAVLAAGYIALVATVMSSMQRFDIPEPNALIPMAVLSLFVLSAALMGFIFFYHPVLMYLDGEKGAALSLFLKTVGAFAAITALFFGILIFSAMLL